MQSEKFDITGMTCAACQANITRKVSALDGVETVDVNLLANSMQVSYDETKTNTGAIIAAVTQIGYGASPAAAAAPASDKGGLRSRWNSRRERAETEQKQMKNRLITSVILLVPLMYLSMGSMLSLPLPSFLLGAENFTVSAILQLLLTLFVVFINRKFYLSGFKALWHRAPNMDSLVAVGSGASLLYGIYDSGSCLCRRSRQSGRGARLYARAVSGIRSHDFNFGHRRQVSRIPLQGQNL